MENNCPDCQLVLEWNNGVYTCGACDAHYVKNGYCSTCESLLEKLQACGSESYFCNYCNELKSRSGARIVFEKKTAVCE